MSDLREVIARTVMADGQVDPTEYDYEEADAVLAAMQNHLTNDERIRRAVSSPGSFVPRAESESTARWIQRAVIAALLDEGETP